MATIQERLNDAEAAMHDLMTGKQVRVFVDQNGERVEYSQANRSFLATYINELKAALGQGTGSGPMRFFF